MKKTYKIRLQFPHYGLGLCNQLCNLVNALENAFQIMSLGSGVVLKPNIRRALMDGCIMKTFPPEGYHAVDNQCIGFPKYLRPSTQRLEIEWKDETQVNFMSALGHDNLHWLDGVPDEVCIYVDLFRTSYHFNDFVNFDEVVDLDAMNRLLQPFHIRIVQGSDGHPLDIMYRSHCLRRSTLFRSLISMIRFTETTISRARQYNYPQKQQRKYTSVVHLRNEDDIIMGWDKEKLNQKYKDAIKENINPNESDVIVLTTNPTTNDVVRWMQEKGYQVHYMSKTGNVLDRLRHHDPTLSKDQRELHAVCDMEMSAYCDHTFIGACNIETLGGSTFSFFLFCRMPSHVKKVMIDMDDLSSPPTIVC